MIIVPEMFDQIKRDSEALVVGREGMHYKCKL